MRALVLGAGGMGARAAETVAALDAVSSLVVADRDLAASERVAAACGSKARATTLDVTDGRALRAALDVADAVLNLVGPFQRFGASVLAAAIAARVPYLDICDDPEPTLEMLALDSRAREAGVVAVVGLGASPGISNLLAAMAAAGLDEVREIVTGWSVEAASGEGGGGGGGVAAGSEVGTADHPSAAMLHWIEQCSGTVPGFEDGRFARVKPLRPIEVDYPGIGRRRLWTVGHPEAITLPRRFAGLRRSVNAMVLPPLLAEALEWVAGEVDAGRLGVRQGASAVLDGSAFAHVTGRRGTGKAEPAFPPLFAVASGARGGRSATSAAALRAWPAGGMAGVTGVPVAVGLDLLAHGRIAAPGVAAPESCVPAEEFLAALAPYCTLPAPVAASDLVELTGS